ncbi:MAG TPA: hypothetical protein VMV61_00725 [Patescibacteria group bacterium]|nr:hypothetical protein [Patescibacteria group bacterium]
MKCDPVFPPAAPRENPFVLGRPARAVPPNLAHPIVRLKLRPELFAANPRFDGDEKFCGRLKVAPGR